ncbi:MBOAT-domain-containing protein [Suhomyces tanzawaensis NRRL Y-17324]|uniref:MBOAT-domain-containing protein n=1 Tax=Suhomyces tanzawaensis NRRL Y-17324 TaxID=984487 RepID=A0A1E4SEE4_9ASCO|nr:MBOAT-domain-containing protein [Suhomyces tanzawaensis NRRL Y-17324]ODV77836.1 MBOAT-domain-containing protein [Suhomyces tanzawaensis NRRL Y-17324]
MTFLSEFLSFFSLEALDTRLLPNEQKKQAVQKRSNPVSKWHTLEFKFYMLVFAITVPLMYKTAMDASNETNPNYPRFQHLLSDGWLFGRKVDNSDQQYAFFRNNFGVLAAFIVIHWSLRRLIGKFFQVTKRTYYDFGFGVFFLFAIHGFNTPKLLIHIAINYSITHFIKNHRAAIAVTWVYGLLTLFVNDWYWDYPTGISIIDHGFKGIVERWDVFYNFTLLRMMSFNMDYLERAKEIENAKVSLDKDETKLSTLSYLDDRQRLTAPLPIVDYNWVNYFAYLTYTPLFIAGPIVTFNDFIYQSNYQSLPSVKDYTRTFRYFLRLVFCVLVMEFLLHFMYVVAVSKTKAWEGDTPFQISMLGMFNLNIIWLKLLIPWRLFRFWSLLDGIDPPENMIRCMDNNYSALAFWRAWHRSFNRWVIRYIYIPMGGGGKYRIINSLLVFSFVAIWHDIELKLLMWGWLVVVFLIPEISATIYFKRFEHEWWFRHLCAVGAVVNIWMMMIANLYGFCLGNDGTLALLREMFNTVSGIEFFIFSSGALFVGAQVMFELREAEKRKGIDVRC